MNKWIEEEAGKYYAIVKDDGNTYESFIAGASGNTGNGTQRGKWE